MFASSRLLNLVRGFRGDPPDAVPDSTRRIIDLSDEISAINKRIRERSRPGSPDDIADRARLKLLMAELQSDRPGSKA